MPERPTKTPLLERPVQPWIQGLLLGVCIGAAFAGGWWLAKSNFGPKDDAQGDDSVASAEPVWDANKVPIAAFSLPRTAAPAKAETNAVAGKKRETVSVVRTPSTTTPQGVSPSAPNASNAPKDVSVSQPVHGENSAPIAATKPAAPVRAPESPTVPVLASVPVAVEPVSGAFFEITTEPGASVYLLPEGVPVAGNPTAARRLSLGVADAQGRLSVSPAPALCVASAVLVFEHPERLAITRQLPRREGRPVAIDAPMTLKAGSLAVLATPSVAEVFVDDVLCGSGVVTLAVAPKVKHRVEVRLTGAESHRQEVEVAPGATHFIRANLIPPAPLGGDILFLGLMRALALRSDVTVLVDGSPVRIVDGLVQAVLPGRRKVSLVTRPATASGRAVPLWERDVVINAGSAVSFSSEDVSGARVAPIRTAAVVPAANERALAAPSDSVRLYATLMDERGRGISLAKARFSFDNAKPTALADGALVLPVNREGILELSVPGYPIESRTLNFPAPGARYISVVLRAAPKPSTEEWRAVVKAVSTQDAVLILSNPAGRLLTAGQTIALVPATVGRAELLKLSILHVSGGNVICQVLPGQSGRILPREGVPVVVRFLSLAPPPPAVRL